jgi:hypothetical protein
MDLVFMPKQSLTPNKLVLYTEILQNRDGVLELYGKRKKSTSHDPAEKKSAGVPLIEKKFHNFEISISAQRKIEQKITWLYHLARSRYVVTQKGKQLFNFKMAFITLTLPSSQQHPTAQITSECLNQWLIEMKRDFNLTNYVWRLEFQANSNVHYHIATDTFLDFERVREVWNRCIAKLGYVQRYREKMSKMSFQDYFNAYSDGKPENFAKLKDRYFAGKTSDWFNPPSVDVKSCTSGKSIAQYIAKYFNKKEKSGCQKNELDNEENSFSLRLWYCSRSLSKLESIKEYLECAPIPFKLLISSVVNAKLIVCKYVEMVYFDIKNCSAYVKSVLYPLFRNYANSVGYSSA